MAQFQAIHPAQLRPARSNSFPGIRSKRLRLRAPRPALPHEHELAGDVDVGHRDVDVLRPEVEFHRQLADMRPAEFREVRAFGGQAEAERHRDCRAIVQHQGR